MLARVPAVVDAGMPSDGRAPAIACRSSSPTGGARPVTAPTTTPAAAGTSARALSAAVANTRGAGSQAAVASSMASTAIDARPRAMSEEDATGQRAERQHRHEQDQVRHGVRLAVEHDRRDAAPVVALAPQARAAIAEEAALLGAGVDGDGLDARKAQPSEPGGDIAREIEHVVHEIGRANARPQGTN